MKAVVASALAAAAITCGLAGGAAAAPLNDPRGLCTHHDDAGNCTASWSDSWAIVNIVFPAQDPQEQAIVDYVTKIANDYDQPSETRPNMPVAKRFVTVKADSFTSGPPDTGTQSAVLKVDTYVSGGPYPNVWYRSFVWDKASMAPVTFATLFKNGTQPLNTIMPIVQDAASRNAGNPISIDPAVGLDPKRYQSFAITDDAVIFYFGNNELVQRLAQFQVSVPRDAIADMLTPGL